MSTLTYLMELSTSECEHLLAASSLGRLGVVLDGRPEIFPVSHVYDDQIGRVAFPTNESTKWRAALDWPWVAFEVDGLDPDGTAGWSVAVVGRAEEITDQGVIERLTRRRQARWCVEPGVRWLAIEPEKTTGRRIRTPGDT